MSFYDLINIFSNDKTLWECHYNFFILRLEEMEQAHTHKDHIPESIPGPLIQQTKG